jgi:hypothetical protein
MEWLASVRGGNQSWTGIVKRMDASRCDYLFVHVGDGRRWFIPSERVEGTTSICLGGPKYADTRSSGDAGCVVRTGPGGRSTIALA